MKSILAVLGGGRGAVGVAIVCALLLAAGFYVQQGRNAEQAAEQVAATLAAPENNATAPAQTDNKVVAQSDAEPEAPDVMTIAPAFDEVRRETDGMTVIAGRGVPGAMITVLKDGVEIATSKVDRAGKFATLAVIPPDGLGHSLTLSQQTTEGAQASEGEVLLAPLAAPVDIAKVAAEEAITAETTAASGSVEETLAADPAKAIQPVETAQIAEPAGSVAMSDQVAEVISPTPDTAVQNTVVAEVSAPKLETPDQVGGSVTATLQGQNVPLQEGSEQVVASLDRAPATPQPPTPTAILRSTPEGVELLNRNVPEVMDNVAIDTISYSEEGEVQLAGRAQRDAISVRVYLDNNSVVILPVDSEGRWRGDVPDVDEGIYTLRVDEVSSDGRVSSRVETPFKREAPEVLAAVSGLAGPINAITVQKGATLWAIARDRYGEGELYVRVFEANKEAIRDPNLIYPGQIFELPE